MSGFKDEEFSLEAFREAVSTEGLAPGGLSLLHDVLCSEGWRERGERLRRESRRLLEDRSQSEQLLRPGDRAGPEDSGGSQEDRLLRSEPLRGDEC